VVADMSKYSNKIVDEFRSEKNRRQLMGKISSVIRPLSPEIKLIAKNFDSLLSGFVETIRNEWKSMKPSSGVSVDMVLDCYNKRFIKFALEFAGMNEKKTMPEINFELLDGEPTTRTENLYKIGNPSLLLGNWRKNISHLMSVRDDSGAIAAEPKYRGPNAPNPPENQYYFGTDLGVSGPQFIFGDTNKGSIDEEIADHNIGREMYLTGSANLLNIVPPKDAYLNEPFGVENPVLDKHLMENNLAFNIHSKKCSIPFWQRSLVARNYDRHIGDDIAATEYGYRQYGYNMSSLYDKVNKKLRYKMVNCGANKSDCYFDKGKNSVNMKARKIYEVNGQQYFL